MSQSEHVSDRGYCAAGVFKLDYTVAGFPDLIKVAREWSKDPGFHELIVRKVSESNFGIQFVYIGQNRDRGFIAKYRNDLEKRFGAVYAVDYNENTSEEPADRAYEGLVVLKGWQKQAALAA
ncbi:MAG: hypothetical protein K1X79_14110 [Oligoflexia bacterium]|nr:hypothetical protein [Oligoflexia bacterium]